MLTDGQTDVWRAQHNTTRLRWVYKNVLSKLYHTENSKTKEHTVYIQTRGLIMNCINYTLFVCKFNYMYVYFHIWHLSVNITLFFSFAFDHNAELQSNRMCFVF